MSNQRLFIDQTGREILIPEFPSRIVSLVPSQTELLSDLGLDDKIVGITKFCIHPTHIFNSKKRVGGTKNVNFDAVAALRPDLIIANKEENDKNQIEYLASQYPVWISDVKSFEDALAMIKSIGTITGKDKKASKLTLETSTSFKSLEENFNQPKQTPIKTAYLIWNKPMMAVGGDTFINDMMKRCGLQNIFESHESRYPEITLDELSGADVILLSSEPFPFKEKHLAEFKSMLPSSQIILADGELFSWYGSRMIQSAEYLENLRTQIVKAY